MTALDTRNANAAKIAIHLVFPKKPTTTPPVFLRSSRVFKYWPHQRARRANACASRSLAPL